jgi:esterase/lipase
MGGVIAAYLASHYTVVKKIVLAAPAFRYFHFKDGKLDIKSLNKAFQSIPNIFKEFKAEQVMSKILKTPISTTIEFTKLVAYCQNCVNNITCDTLTIHGLNDNIVPSEGTEYVYNSIKSKTNILINVKDLNHDCFISPRSNEINQLVKNFLIKTPKNKKEIIEI